MRLLLLLIVLALPLIVVASVDQHTLSYYYNIPRIVVTYESNNPWQTCILGLSQCDTPSPKYRDIKPGQAKAMYIHKYGKLSAQDWVNCREVALLSFLTLTFSEWINPCQSYKDEIVFDTAHMHVEECKTNKTIDTTVTTCDISTFFFEGFVHKSILPDTRGLTYIVHDYELLNGTLSVGTKLLYTGDFHNNKPVIGS